MDQHVHIEKTIKEGYKIDIGDIFNKSFEIYKKSLGVTAVGILIIAIGVIALALIFLLGFLGINFSDFDPVSLSSTVQTESYFLGVSLLGLVVQAIYAPATAGFIEVAKNVKENKDNSLSTIFSYYKSKHLMNLVLFGILVAILNGLIGYLIQFVIFMPWLAYVTNAIIATCTIFMIPLIIYKDCSVGQAIDYGLRLSFKNFFILLLAVIVLYICSYLGVLGCGIGIIFTIPFLYAGTFCIYDEALGKEEISEIDQIGTSE